MEANRITVEETKKLLDRNEPLAFLDARNPKAWGESDNKLPGAIRVPADQLEEYLGEIPKDRQVIAYCT